MKKWKYFLVVVLVAALLAPMQAQCAFQTNGHVLVLMYHKLSDNPAEHGAFCISPEKFERDLIRLTWAGYTFATVSELKTLQLHKEKIAVITFDDGYESDYTKAMPLLEKYGAKGTFFIFGAGVGTAGYLSRSQLKALSDKPFVEIGNHSYALHEQPAEAVEAAYATLAGRQAAKQDFEKNSRFLEEITGKEITALSYPYGLYNMELDTYFKKNGVLVTLSSEATAFTAVHPQKPAGRVNRGNTEAFWFAL